MLFIGYSRKWVYLPCSEEERTLFPTKDRFWWGRKMTDRRGKKTRNIIPGSAKCYEEKNKSRVKEQSEKQEVILGWVVREGL